MACGLSVGEWVCVRLLCSAASICAASGREFGHSSLSLGCIIRWWYTMWHKTSVCVCASCINPWSVCVCASCTNPWWEVFKLSSAYVALLLPCVKSSLYFGSQSLIRDAFIRQFILICALPFNYSDISLAGRKISLFLIIFSNSIF